MEKVIVAPCAKMEYGMLIGRERVIVVLEQCEDGRVIGIFEVEGNG